MIVFRPSVYHQRPVNQIDNQKRRTVFVALLFNRSKERDYVDMHDFSITFHVNCMDESVIKREWLSCYNPK